jgi:hypothetical protein
MISAIAQPQPFLGPPITCMLTSSEFCTLDDLVLRGFAHSAAYYTIHECNSHPLPLLEFAYHFLPPSYANVLRASRNIHQPFYICATIIRRYQAQPANHKQPATIIYRAVGIYVLGRFDYNVWSIICANLGLQSRAVILELPNYSCILSILQT